MFRDQNEARLKKEEPLDDLSAAEVHPPHCFLFHCFTGSSDVTKFRSSRKNAKQSLSSSSTSVCKLSGETPAVIAMRFPRCLYNTSSSNLSSARN